VGSSVRYGGASGYDLERLNSFARPPRQTAGRLQPAQKEGYMASEDGFKDVNLVEHEEAQTVEEAPDIWHARIAHQPGLADIRCHRHDARSADSFRPFIWQHGPVDFSDQFWVESTCLSGLPPAYQLVGCERLQWIENQNPRFGVALQ
jgi:hypothetical protein